MAGRGIYWRSIGDITAALSKFNREAPYLLAGEEPPEDESGTPTATSQVRDRAREIAYNS